jgi:uncharacterized protein YbjT (DUF2867 family)
LKILVTGASGFIGSRLVRRLLASSSANNYQITCMTRNAESLKDYFNDKKVLNIVEADVSNSQQILKVMGSEFDIAFYLIHSMEGSTKGWKEFAEKDRISAENFAGIASKSGVKRIVYLSGLSHGKDEDLSEHLRSRNQVGEILKTSTAKVTIFRAAIILGQGGGSFEMLKYLVERLPIMVCPKWVLTKSQPIAVEDVVTYLVKSIDVKETEGREFEIGGPDVLTYVDMMKRYAKMINKSVRILIIPFLTPRLSSYWVDLVTPVKASLARPLIDSLKHEARVNDDSIKIMIPIQLKNFEESIKAANEKEKNKKRKPQ